MEDDTDNGVLEVQLRGEDDAAMLDASTGTFLHQIKVRRTSTVH